MKKYVLVGYKPDSEDYCRGCRMASYGSDFFTLETDQKEDVIDKIASCWSEEFGCNEKEYEEIELFIRDEHEDSNEKHDIFEEAKIRSEEIKGRMKKYKKEKAEKEKAEKEKAEKEAVEYKQKEFERKWQQFIKLKEELGE